jgi:hypothetical protein
MVVKDGFERFASDPKLMNNFITRYHRASAHASHFVFEKCNDLLTEITKETETGELSSDAANKLLDIINDIYTAIRKDINPRARYFRVVTLWHNQKKGQTNY